MLLLLSSIVSGQDTFDVILSFVVHLLFQFEVVEGSEIMGTAVVVVVEEGSVVEGEGVSVDAEETDQ